MAKITVALAGYIVLGGLRRLSAWSTAAPSSTQARLLPTRLGCRLVGATLILLLILTVPHFVATASGAYRLAVVTAHETPEFTELLGAPVQEAWFSKGKMDFGNPARADLLIPVVGSRRKGNLHVLAIKDDGQWKLTELTLELAQPYQRLNLLTTISRSGSPAIPSSEK